MMDQASKLRSMVSDKKNDKNIRIFSILSGDTKIGKTNFAMNMAIEYKKLGYNVLYLDATGDHDNLIEHVNLSKVGLIEDNLDYALNIEDYVIIGPGNINILLGADNLINIKNLSKQDKDKIYHKVKNVNKYDLVIIDNQAGVCDSMICFLDFANENILVTGSEVDNIINSYSLLKILSTNHRENIGVVVNRCQNETQAIDTFEKLKDTSSRFLALRLDYLGELEYDEEMLESVKLKKSIALYNDKSLYVRDIKDIIENLETEESKKNAFTLTQFEQIVKDFFG